MPRRQCRFDTSYRSNARCRSRWSLTFPTTVSLCKSQRRLPPVRRQSRAVGSPVNIEIRTAFHRQGILVFRTDHDHLQMRELAVAGNHVCLVNAARWSLPFGSRTDGRRSVRRCELPDAGRDDDRQSELVESLECPLHLGLLRRGRLRGFHRSSAARCCGLGSVRLAIWNARR